MIMLRDARLLGALLSGDHVATAPQLAALDAKGWSRLLAVAGEELISPELALPLADPALAPLVPAEVVDHLQSLRVLNGERNARIAAQLREMLPAFASCGLQPLLLKGARNFIEGETGSVARVMVDLDLLFPADALDAAAHVLEGLGYQKIILGDDPAFGGPHAVGYFARRGEPAMLDLHREPLAASHLLPAASMLRRARPIAAPPALGGVGVLVPAPADELLQAVLHDMVQHESFRLGLLSLRRLREIARRLPLLQGPDWAALRAQATDVQVLGPLAVALRLVAKVFGAEALPAGCQPLVDRRIARMAVGRTLLNARGLVPGPVNVALSRAIEAFASHNHRPDQDGPLPLWRARRVGEGIRRLFS